MYPMHPAQDVGFEDVVKVRVVQIHDNVSGVLAGVIHHSCANDVRMFQLHGIQLSLQAFRIDGMCVESTSLTAKNASFFSTLYTRPYAPLPMFRFECHLYSWGSRVSLRTTILLFFTTIFFCLSRFFLDMELEFVCADDEVRDLVQCNKLMTSMRQQRKFEQRIMS